MLKLFRGEVLGSFLLEYIFFFVSDIWSVVSVLSFAAFLLAYELTKVHLKKEITHKLISLLLLIFSIFSAFTRFIYSKFIHGFAPLTNRTIW